MKIKEMLGPVVAVSAYFQDVLAKKKAQLIRKVPSTIQEPSTIAVLQRDPSKDAEHFNRPKVDAVVRGLGGEVFINERSVKVGEVIVEEFRRRAVKNTLGQAYLSGSTPQQKTKAIDAFIKTRGIIQLTEAEKAIVHAYYKELESPSDRHEEIKRAFEAVMTQEAVLIK